jgi:hypothetical protein
VVVSVTGGLLPLTHCTTEQGRILLPVTVSVRAGEPAAILDWDSEVIPGAARFAGDDKVNGEEFEIPTELDTETATGPGNAVSVARIEAVTWVELTKVVARGKPFQFTIASLVKFVPVTVSVIPAALQYGVEACEVVEAESEVIAGGVPVALLIVKKTTLETSVVVVAVVLEEPDVAEPGISTATCTVPAVARYEAGIGAVRWFASTYVVLREIGFALFAFQRSIAPEMNPVPLAVIVKPPPPTVAVWGLRNVSVDDDVWVVRLVLNSEQADASPHATNATISHLREHIRTRSSRATRRKTGQTKTLSTIRVLR